MSLKSTLRRAAGLLVELPPEEETEASPHGEGVSNTDKMWEELEQAAKAQPAPARTVEQIVRDAHGPNLDQIQVSADTPPPSAAPDGTMDFSAIYRKAALPPSPFTAEQILDMIAALPQELPLATRRQTVNVTLNAMGKAIGATPETVVADASRKLAALSAYTDSVGTQTAGLLENAQRDIADLQQQIEEEAEGHAGGPAVAGAGHAGVSGGIASHGGSAGIFQSGRAALEIRGGGGNRAHALICFRRGCCAAKRS